MSLRDTIKSIILAGGSVCFPHKLKPRHMMDTEKLCVHYPPGGGATVYFIYPSLGEKFTDLDEAIDTYCRMIFTKKNLGLAYIGISRHGLTTQCFDDMKEGDLRRLVKKYWNEYFELDYGDLLKELAERSPQQA